MKLPLFNLKRRFFVPEVIQTSALDCGPAALKCLLEGFGISASYGRLREACQTDVDGTSIDTLEEVAAPLGLEAEQIIIPADHLLLPEAQALPAIVVVRLPNGLAHFVVVWRRHGDWLQVMDPAIGRRWVRAQPFLKELYLHVQPVPGSAWREWAGSEDFLVVLRRRLADIGVSKKDAVRLIESALGDTGWRWLAALSAATRMIAALLRSGGLERGQQANRVLEKFLEHARTQTPSEGATIPPAYWSVRPVLIEGESEEESLFFYGVVLVRVLGALSPSHSSDNQDQPQPLSRELVAALEEPPNRPRLELLRLLRADGLLAPTFLVGAQRAPSMSERLRWRQRKSPRANPFWTRTDSSSVTVRRASLCYMGATYKSMPGIKCCLKDHLAEASLRSRRY